jgi:hypothetical protein
MLSKYWAPAATYSLNKGIISLHDRDSFAQLLRGVQLFATMEPEVLEITSTPDRCVGAAGNTAWLLPCKASGSYYLG